MSAANRHRGDVEAEIDGRRHVLRLTLGSLAELEDALGANSLPALIARLSDAPLSARDLSEIIAAGLRGGGSQATAEDVFAMHVSGGLQGAAQLVNALLKAAFGDAKDES